MFDINPRACMQTPRIADFAEFSFHARNFCEGVPGIRQAKVTKQAVKDAPERVCIHALVSDGGESVGQHAIKRKSRLIYGKLASSHLFMETFTKRRNILLCFIV